jgi:hydrogenase expression/formation protein HypC
MGRIDYAGTENTACLEYTPEAEEGDFVIVHAGFALQKLDVEEARLTLETLAELDALMEADRTDNAEDPA